MLRSVLSTSTDGSPDMYYRYIPQLPSLLPRRENAATQRRGASQGVRSEDVIALAMLSVPLIMFGSVLAIFLIITAG
jgi:hypothetical protein